MRIAEGRTRIFGSKEESIFRKSRGRRPYCQDQINNSTFSRNNLFASLTRTLAISSLFLNSPFTSVTFPFSSNSVHRSLNSFPGFDDIILPPLTFLLLHLESSRGGRFYPAEVVFGLKLVGSKADCLWTHGDKMGHVLDMGAHPDV